MKNIKEFIVDYYDPDETFWVSILDRSGKGGMSNFKHDMKTFYDFESLIYKNNMYKKDIYLTLSSFENTKSRLKGDIRAIKSLFFDVDTNASDVVPNIISSLGEPSYLIQTSPDKYQLIYKFESALDKTMIDDFEKVSYSLTHHFKTDKQTFDVTRIFRAPFYTNNKNGFQTKVKASGHLYAFNDFVKYIALHNIELKTPNKPVKTISSPKVYKDIPNTYFNPHHKYYDRYINMVKKKNGNNSAADLGFILMLRNARFNPKDAISILTKVREDLFTKHGHDLNNYLNTLIAKTNHVNNASRETTFIEIEQDDEENTSKSSPKFRR